MESKMTASRDGLADQSGAGSAPEGVPASARSLDDDDPADNLHDVL
jgi:hypothetical protein